MYKRNKLPGKSYEIWEKKKKKRRRRKEILAFAKLSHKSSFLVF